MYGYFGDFGAASDDYKAKIESQKSKIKSLRKKVWKAKIFTYERKQAELAVQAAVNNLRVLESKYRKAKRDEAKAKRDEAKGEAKKSSKTATAASATLSQAQIDQIKALVQQLIDAGVEVEAAEEQVKASVLPAAHRLRYPRGFFRPFDRRGPRPARSIDPVVDQRSIDPRIRQQSIDPRMFQTSIDPMVPQIGIDPRVQSAELSIASGAFQFPPANLSADEDEDYEADLAGLLDTVKGYAQKPLVLGALGLAAVLYGPKLLRAAKGMMGKRSKSRRHRR